MRILALILLILTATHLTAADKTKEQIEASAKKIKELQKERIAALKFLVDENMKLLKSGSIGFGDLLEARISLLKAELEAAEKDSERIMLYNKIVEVLKEFETVAKDRFDNGRGTSLDVYKVKVKRLEMEIIVEQLTIKEAKESK